MLCFLQEKVEEDRFIKEQEKQINEKKLKMTQDEVMRKLTKEQSIQHQKMESERAALISTAMKELSDLLLETGDKVTTTTARKIAVWKVSDKL